MTLEEAEDAAAREGLVLVTSTRSSTGYKGVWNHAGRYQAEVWKDGTTHKIGSSATSHEAALNYSRFIGPARAAIEAAAALSANFTQDDAEAAAAKEGLVLVTSIRSSTGYKGVSIDNGQYRAKGKRGNEKTQNIGNYTTIYEAALHYSRHIGAQQAAAEKAAEEASDGKRKSSMASFTSAVIQKIMTSTGPRANKVALGEVVPPSAAVLPSISLAAGVQVMVMTSSGMAVASPSQWPPAAQAELQLHLPPHSA